MALVVLVLAGGATAARGIVQPADDDPLAGLTKVEPILRPSLELRPVEQVFGELRPEIAAAWKSLVAEKSSRGDWQAFIDQRSGLVEIAEGGGLAWIPGAGNHLTRADIAAHLGGRGEVDLSTLESLSRGAVRSFSALLGTDGSNLVLDRAASRQVADHFWQVEFDVLTDAGLPIEGARVFFRVNNGNLVQWGAARVPPPGTSVPELKIGADEALAALGEYVEPDPVRDGYLSAGVLKILLAEKGAPATFVPGRGYELLPVWEFQFRRDAFGPTWRARVDAVTGEVVEFLDVNRYSSVTGGYWPVSWRISGVEQSQVTVGWPFVGINPLAENSNSSGVYYWDGNAQAASHSGPYVVVADQCAGSPGSATSDGSGDIDFGSIAAASTPGNCTVQNGIADNTAAARQQYYHLNKIMEKGRAYNPSNLWLQSQVTANVNIPLTCNAFWDGSSVNFYQSGGGCGNTGEDAGISLHEWGHGFDDFDGSPPTADNGTGETYGDFTAALQTRDSCTGRGFILSGASCPGYGNACSDCDGVRDIDWGQHADNVPWTVSGFTRTDCPTNNSYIGPCGNREGHCESYVSSGALWDFANYDLQSGCSGRNAGFPDWNCPGAGGPYTPAGAWTVADRLWYRSRSSADQAFTCSTTGTWSSNGCNAGSNWKTMRAVDDDDGDLTNGTPHSCQLAAAFGRHGIACTTDTAWDTCFRGCTPPSAPTLAPPVVGNNRINLSWTSSGGVIDVFRNEVGCNSGFTQVADDVSGTSFEDPAVANGTTYYYQIVEHPIGNEACSSEPSTCLSGTPSVAASAVYVEGSAEITALPTDNDGDGYVDNCETGTVAYEVYNDGNVALTNVTATITSAEASVSLVSGNPANLGALAVNGRVASSFDFTLDGAACLEFLDFEISVTADQMAAVSSDDSFRLGPVETDTTSRTDSFETDADGWSLSGFARDNTQATDGSWSVSSTGGSNTCDAATSPSFTALATTQMVMSVRYDIEAESGNSWDRANVHAVTSDGLHFVVSPSGASYTQTQPPGSFQCHVTFDDGWVGQGPSWPAWEGDAIFDLSPFAGHDLQLEVNYNTDALVNEAGVWFDDVRFTDLGICDAQADVCTPCTPPDTPAGLTASATVAGQIDLSWSAIAVPPTNYRIYRSTAMGGPYSQVGTVGGGTTTFSDTTVTDGVTYYYVVRAYEGCESGNSNEASATAFADCTTAPTFGGVSQVSEIVAGGSCGLRVEWSAGTNNCSGEPLVYNVYRSTTSGFTPGSGNRVASCVTGTSWDDTAVSGGNTYFYSVRAEDAESGGGGPCRDGNEDAGTAEASDSLSPGSATLIDEDFDALAAGAYPAGWVVGTFNGGASSWIGARACTGSSAPNVLRYGGAASCTSNYGNNQQAVVVTSAMNIPPGVTAVAAQFDHRWNIQAGDYGVLYVSNDFATFYYVGNAYLSGQAYSDGTGFTGSAAGSMVTTTVDLAQFCTDNVGNGFLAGCAGETTLYLGWAGVTNSNLTNDGWYIDDVLISYSAPSCSAAPNAVDFLTATSTSTQNVVEWLNPSGGPYGSTRIRWSTSGHPADPTDGTLLVDQNDGAGNHGTTTHSSLTNGTTYYYSAFVDNGSGEYSARKTVAARPFDTSGAVKWAYATGASALTPPAIASIYGVANDRVVHSMDGSANGVWPAGWSPLAMNGSAQARPPVVPLSFAGAGKVAFVGSQDGRVYAADANSGGLLWSSGVLGSGLQAAPAGYFSGFGGSSDVLMIGTRNAGTDNELVALDPEDGSQLWSFDNGGGAGGIGIISGDASIDYANQRVYFASRSRLGGSSDTVWALDFTGVSATLLWSEAVGDVDGSPILANGKIYVGTLAGEVVALDAATGAVQWAFDADDGPVKSYVWPRFGSSEILFSTTSRVWSITDNGGSAGQNWSHAAISNPSPPLVFTLSGTPYAWVGSDDGSLHQLDISGVSPVATSVQLGDGSATVGAPALDVFTSTLFVGAENGNVYSVALPVP